MTLIRYVRNENAIGGSATVSWSGGAFSIITALRNGGGSFTVDDQTQAGLITALDAEPSVARAGGAGAIDAPNISQLSTTQIVSAGNLGATYLWKVPASASVLVGTLTTDCVITVSQLAPFAQFKFLLKQDGTGGHAVTLSDGISSLVLAVDDTPNAWSEVVCWSPNSTDLVVTEG